MTDNSVHFQTTVPSSIPPPNNSVLHEVDELVRRGAFQRAIAILEEVEPRDNANVVLWGFALLGDGRLEQARWKFLQVLAREPGSAEAHAGIGMVLLRQDLFDEAERTFDQALDLSPRHPLALYGRAVVQQENRRLEEAESTLRDAVAENPEFFEAYALLAGVLIRLEQYDAALDAADVAIRLGTHTRDDVPNELLNAHLDGAVSAFELGFYSQARDRLKALQERRGQPPDDPREALQWGVYAGVDHLLLGMIAARLRHLDSALEHFEAAVDASEVWRVDATRGAAEAYSTMGDYRNAYASLSRIASLDHELNADSDYSWNQGLTRAETMFLLGRHDDARGLCKSLVGTRPEDPRPWVLLRNVYNEQAELAAEPMEASLARSRGREAANQAMTLLLRGLEERKTVGRLVSLAFLAVGLGQHDEARTYLQDAASLDERNQQVWLLRGLIEAREENLERAAGHFRRGHILDPEDRTARVHLGAAYVRLGLLLRAEEEFRQLLRAAEGDIDAHIGLGETLTALGEQTDPAALDEAIDHFSTALRLDASMVDPDPSRRAASSRLSRRRRANVYYGRGYAHVGAYEATSLIARRGSRASLKRAEQDFAWCCELDPGHGGARRALSKIKPLVRPAPAATLGEIAPFIVCTLALTVLALASLNFFTGWPDTRLLGATEWTVTTFGSLVLLVAGLSLPDLLKLKLGGVELEKGPETRLALEVGLQKTSFGPGFDMPIPSPDIPQNPERPKPRPMKDIPPDPLSSPQPAKKDAEEGATRRAGADSSPADADDESTPDAEPN